MARPNIDNGEVHTRILSRYVKYSQKPLVAWWPLGWLFIALLLLLFLLGVFVVAPKMERDIGANVAMMLNDFGDADLQVAVDGQNVRISGELFRFRYSTVL